MSNALNRMGQAWFRRVEIMIDDALRNLKNEQGMAGGTLNAANISGTLSASSLPAHAPTHQTGGSDALTGKLDANARLAISNNGTLVASRRGLNFIPGTGVTLTVLDNPTSERVDVTVTVTGGGGTTTTTGQLLFFNSEILLINGDGITFG